MRRLFFALLLASALTGAFFLLQRTAAPAACTLGVRVIDGRTEAPLANATVVIAETGKRYPTGVDGTTGRIAIPFRPLAQSGEAAVPWTEATVLAYCDGYYPYALFHVCLSEGETRDNLTLYLFPNDGSMPDTPFVLVEAPPVEWSRALIEQHRPG